MEHICRKLELEKIYCSHSVDKHPTIHKNIEGGKKKKRVGEVRAGASGAQPFSSASSAHSFSGRKRGLGSSALSPAPNLANPTPSFEPHFTFAMQWTQPFIPAFTTVAKGSHAKTIFFC